MLPKVATHIHTASRAAGPIHSHKNTLRNVLQIRSFGSSSSVSCRRGNAQVLGDVKHDTGNRRFNSGYKAAGSIVTQDNTASSNEEKSTPQNDEGGSIPRSAFVTAMQTRSRMRSASFSTPSNDGVDHGKELGISQRVQLHTRSQHGFAGELSGESSSEMIPQEESTTPLPTTPELPEAVEQNTSPDILPHSPATNLSQAPQKQGKPDRPGKDIFLLLQNARNLRDHAVVTEAIEKLRSEVSGLTASEYTMAMDALFQTRLKGEPITPILELFNEMNRRSIFPTFRTYLSLIAAFITRDEEIQLFETAFEARLRRHELTGWLETHDFETDRIRLTRLKEEKNFDYAMIFFELMVKFRNWKNVELEWPLYRDLLRGAAYHSDMDAALTIFSHLENHTSIHPEPLCYKYLLQVTTNCGDVEGTEATFEEFITACNEGRVIPGIRGASVQRDPLNILSGMQETCLRVDHLQVWNQMIRSYFQLGLPEKAREIFERMRTSELEAVYSLKSTPRPAASTFTTIITGLCQKGDVQLALGWFYKLLQQEDVSWNPYYVMSSEPTKPDAVAWTIMLDALAMHGMIEDLNRLFTLLLENQKTYKVEALSLIDRILVVSANLENLEEINTEEALQRLQHATTVLSEDLPLHVQLEGINKIAEGYIAKDCLWAMKTILEMMKRVGLRALSSEAELDRKIIMSKVQDSIESLTKQIFDKVGDTLIIPFSLSIQLCDLHITFDVKHIPKHAVGFVRSYLAKKNKTKLPVWKWEAVLNAVISVSSEVSTAQSSMDDIAEVLKDMESSGIELESLRPAIAPPVIQLLRNEYDAEQLGSTTAFKETDPHTEHPKRHKTTALDLYHLGGIIQVQGRSGELDKVGQKYSDAQKFISDLPSDERPQTWQFIEDSMIIALAYAGDLKSAHIHRARILQHGGVPSAYAYGALILHEKDTTDAISLFHESQTNGVVPNRYLYNVVISQLAEALPPYYILELFQRMKVNNIWPSSISYGAAIQACALKGDYISAEYIYADMKKSPSPSFPPETYDVMIRLYMTAESDRKSALRKRALYYLKEMRKANLTPSDDVLKLLRTTNSTEPVVKKIKASSTS